MKNKIKGSLSLFKINKGLGLLILLSIFVLIISLSLAISVGAVQISTSTVWGVIINKLYPETFETIWSKGREAIVWNVRFPRSLLAIIVGSGLAIVGASLQAVTRNPLADPHLLGISSGGAFGAILALLHTGVSRFTAATSADRLVLVGVAVSFIIMAGANILIFLGDHRATHTVVFWMLGGLGFAQWDHLIYPLVTLICCGIWLFFKTDILNAMTVGDETATTLGIRVQNFRLIVFTICALITGVMVAFSGMIGFIGLMVPHVVRMIVGGNYLRVLPVSALFGAILLLWADIAARTIMAPEDMPIGIVTGLIGGVFFVWLLRRKL